jgi:hypothetical protein
MKKLSLQINELKFINEFFDGEICLCGGVADFIYTGYDDISDIDILVSRISFMNSMGIESLTNNAVLVRYGFNITYVPDSFFSELTPARYFYGGNYKEYPIDIFIVDQLTDTVFLPENNTKKYGIKITSPNDRISKLINTLNTTIDNRTPQSSRKWLSKKQKQAKTKLELYKKKYPEIYNALFHI